MHGLSLLQALNLVSHETPKTGEVWRGSFDWKTLWLENPVRRAHKCYLKQCKKCSSDGFAFDVFMKHHLTNNFCIWHFVFVLSYPCFEGVFAFLLISGQSPHGVPVQFLILPLKRACAIVQVGLLCMFGAESCCALASTHADRLCTVHLRSSTKHDAQVEWEHPIGKPIRALSIKKNCLRMHCRQTPSFCLAVGDGNGFEAATWHPSFWIQSDWTLLFRLNKKLGYPTGRTKMKETDWFDHQIKPTIPEFITESDAQHETHRTQCDTFNHSCASNTIWQHNQGLQLLKQAECIKTFLSCLKRKMLRMDLCALNCVKVGQTKGLRFVQLAIIWIFLVMFASHNT